MESSSVSRHTLPNTTGQISDAKSKRVSGRAKDQNNTPVVLKSLSARVTQSRIAYDEATIKYNQATANKRSHVSKGDPKRSEYEKNRGLRSELKEKKETAKKNWIALTNEFHAKTGKFQKLQDGCKTGMELLAKTEQAIAVHKIHTEGEWAKYQKETINSPYKNLAWNVASGAAGYATSFGVATVVRYVIGATVPGVGVALLVAAPLHTLISEPLAAKIRAVTYSNPDSAISAANHRYFARKIRDAIRTQFGLEAHGTFSVTVGGEKKNMTAAEILAMSTLDAENAGRGGAISSGLGAAVTDDAPFLSFTMIYTAKDAVSNHLGWVGAGDLGAQLIAGNMAGASTMVISQALRQHYFHPQGAAPNVTKPAFIWAKEAAHYDFAVKSQDEVIRQLRESWNAVDGELTEAYASAGGRNAPETEEVKVLLELQKSIDETIERVKVTRDEAAELRENATMRSSRIRSFAHDVKNLGSTKRTRRPGEPELPGKRIETICSIIGKTMSLGYVVGWSAYTQMASATELAHGIAVSQLNKTFRNMVASTVLIFPGWMSRSQMAGFCRGAWGVARGVEDVWNAPLNRANEGAVLTDIRVDEIPDDDAVNAERNPLTESDVESFRNSWSGQKVNIENILKQNGLPSDLFETVETLFPFMAEIQSNGFRAVIDEDSKNHSLEERDNLMGMMYTMKHIITQEFTSSVLIDAGQNEVVKLLGMLLPAIEDPVRIVNQGGGSDATIV